MRIREDLQVANRALTAIAQITSDPYRNYVQTFATGGSGTIKRPLGTIEAGIAAVAEGGTVHVQQGTYLIANSIAIAKTLTLAGEADPLPTVEPLCNSSFKLRDGVWVRPGMWK